MHKPQHTHTHTKLKKHIVEHKSVYNEEIFIAFYCYVMNSHTFSMLKQLPFLSPSSVCQKSWEDQMSSLLHKVEIKVFHRLCSPLEGLRMNLLELFWVGDWVKFIVIVGLRLQINNGCQVQTFITIKGHQYSLKNVPIHFQSQQSLISSLVTIWENTAFKYFRWLD